MKASLALLAVTSSLAAACVSPAEPTPRDRSAGRTEVVDDVTPLVPTDPRPRASAPRLTNASFALLRRWLDGDASLRHLVDPARGVAFVTVGPAYDPDRETTTDVDRGERLCGDRARRAAESAVRSVLEGARAFGDPDVDHPCGALVCTKTAMGEWDSQTSFGFAKTPSGALVLDSIVVVLDVPLRPGAEGDMLRAERKRVALARATCR